MTDPLSRDELHALIDAKHRNEGWDITTAQADRLLDIAEDHARLHAENMDCAQRWRTAIVLRTEEDGT